MWLVMNIVPAAGMLICISHFTKACSEQESVEISDSSANGVLRSNGGKAGQSDKHSLRKNRLFESKMDQLGKPDI